MKKKGRYESISSLAKIIHRPHTDKIQQSPVTEILQLSWCQNENINFFRISCHKEYQFLWVSWKNTRSSVTWTINLLKQRVIRASDAAVAHIQQVREQDKIPEAEVQSAIKDIWNAALLLLEK